MADENQNANGSDPGAAAPADGSSFDISNEIKTLQDQAEKYKNDYLYLRAEFDNYRKNAIKDRSDLLKFAGERVITDLLEVMDNFDRALQISVTADNYKTYQQGVEMTASALKNLLQKHGVKEVPSEGLAFDPNIHSALSSEINEKMPAGHVSKVFQKAYSLHNKVIRPAQVVVSTKPDA